jgi:hypothetical protein
MNPEEPETRTPSCDMEIDFINLSFIQAAAT